MTRLFLLLLLLIGSANARADYDAVITGNYGGPSGYTYSSGQSACDAYALASAGTSYKSLKYISSSTPDPKFVGNIQAGRCDKAGTTGDTYVTVNYKSVASCPSGGTLSGTRCIGADPPPPGCKKDEATSEYYESAATAAPSKAGFPYCASNGCMTTIDYVGGCVGGGGVLACLFKGKTTGATCKAETDNQQATNWGMGKEKPASANTRVDMPPTAAKDNGGRCPTGSVQGGVDSSGTPICIGRGATPENAAPAPPVTSKPPVTTTNSDGSTTTTQETVKTNTDGSTTTTVTKTIKAADGTSTVSAEANTSKTPTGSDGKADTPDKSNLCKDNPTLSICQNSEVSGKCAETACKGDAIQCATLRAAAVMQCAHEQEMKDLKDSNAVKLGDQLQAGTDPLAASLPSSKNAQVVDAGKLDSTGWLGGGRFFADKTIAIDGYGSVVIPFSKAENVFLVLRAVSMIFGALVSAKILRQSVIGA